MAEEQTGFVEGKGTREQIVNIRIIIIEKCPGQNIPLYMCFIDYAKAFDCVSHRKLWDTMEQMGFPVHSIQQVANLYTEQESVVRKTNGDTGWFKIERGVRQGCMISPGMCNIYSEHIMRCVLEEHHDGITIGGRRETKLRFADDKTLLGTSKEELLGLPRKVKEASMSQNLLINTQKTKIMVVDKGRERKEDFVLDGEKIEEVDIFVYLGYLINTKGSSAQEIRRRLAMGRGAVQNMVSIWKSRGMSLGLKVRFPGPLLFELWFYRRLLGVSWTERKTNKWVLEKIGSVLMLRKSMSERKMRFFGHIIWKNGVEKRETGAREDGRQAEKGQTSNDLVPGLDRMDKLDIAGASQLATDRERWRNGCSTYLIHNQLYCSVFIAFVLCLCLYGTLR